MGSILCCVDDKRNYDGGKEDYYKNNLHQHEDDETVVKMQFKQTLERKEQAQADDLEDGKGVEAEKQQSGKIMVQEPEQKLKGYEVEDHLEEYFIPSDFRDDEEPEDLTPHKNIYEIESGIQFSKNGIISYINDMFALENSSDEFDKWETKLNKEEIKVQIKKGGTKMNTEQPYVKTEIMFNAYYQMEKIIKAIFNKEHRMAWDKNVLQLNSVKFRSPHYYILCQMNKSPLNFANRDFVEKQIKFCEEGVMYCYYTFTEKDKEIQPVPDKVERARTLVGFQKMERIKGGPNNGKILYTMYMQGDMNMKITPKFIAMFLPTGLQDWQRKLTKYINDNYDKI